MPSMTAHDVDDDDDEVIGWDMISAFPFELILSLSIPHVTVTTAGFDGGSTWLLSSSWLDAANSGGNDVEDSNDSG
jgi:hypothetical protein